MLGAAQQATIIAACGASDLWRYWLRGPTTHSVCGATDSDRLLRRNKALKAARTSPLVQQCEKALNDVSTRHVVGLYWVPRHAGVRGNEIADDLARGHSALRFLGPEPALGVSRRDLQKNVSVAGWLTSTGQNGEVLVTARDRLEN